MPARYTETAIEFDRWIAPRIRSALEIILKQSISKADKKMLIRMLKDAHTACNGYLPFGLQVEIVRKLKPDIETEKINSEEAIDKILKNICEI